MRSVFLPRKLTDDEVITWARLGGVVLLFVAAGQALEVLSTVGALGHASRFGGEPVPFMLATVLPPVALGSLLFFSPHRLIDGEAAFPRWLALGLALVLLGLGLYATSSPLMTARLETGAMALPRVLFSSYTLAALFLIFILTARDGWRSPGVARFALASGVVLTAGTIAIAVIDTPAMEGSFGIRWSLWMAFGNPLAFGLVLLGLRTLRPEIARPAALAGAAAVVVGGLAYVSLVVEPSLQGGEFTALATQVAWRLAMVVLLLAFGGVLSASNTLRLAFACGVLVLGATVIAFVDAVSGRGSVFWPPVLSFTIPAALLLLAVVVVEVDARTSRSEDASASLR